MKTARARGLSIALAVGVLAAAALLWRFTPLREITTPDRLATWLATFKDTPWSPLAVVGIYVVGGLIVFPLMVLVAATAIVFDPWLALAVSLTGALLSAAFLYALGSKLARGMLEHAFGSAMKRVNGALKTRGILAVAALRTVPVAPFSVVNFAAGSIGVRFTDYMIGTALGLSPGIIVLTAFASQLRSVWRNPTPGKLAVVICIVLGWIALSWGLQRLITHRARREA